VCAHRQTAQFDVPDAGDCAAGVLFDGQGGDAAEIFCLPLSLKQIMTDKTAIKLFETKKVRTTWDEKDEEWYFSVVDVIGILTDQLTQNGARNYWKVLKKRLKDEGNETVTNCNQLKLPAEDGKMRLTDVASTGQIFRIIQSIPSPKAKYPKCPIPKQ
jgi:hypothetical protein